MSLSKSAKHVLGFTLIELLIVVAIIAILAAIAVPNFLDAQVRAKVARVQQDQRSLATAIETYAVDTKGYPLSDAGKGNLANGDFSPTPGRHGQVDHLGFWMNFLTTPTAYMTVLPYDPFSKSLPIDPTAVPPKYTKDRFSLFTGNGLGDGLTASAGRYSRRSCWALASAGPAQNINLTTTPPAAYASGDCTLKYIKNLGQGDLGKGDINFLMTKDDGLRATTPFPPYPTVILLYDPTNGTGSAGHVVKTGGEMMQTFVTAAPYGYDAFPPNP